MSKESIRSEIRSKQAQISNNEAAIRDYTDRYEELSALKGRLETSQSNLNSVMTSQRQKAESMKSAHPFSRFISNYSNSISDELDSAKANTAKESLSSSVGVVQDKMDEFRAKIESLEEENNSLRSAIDRLQDELRELEREEQYGI